jgi:hypothetical protein
VYLLLKNLKFKKLGIAALIAFVFFLVMIYFLPTEKYSWVKSIKETIPQKYKNKIKSTIFIVPELNKKVLDMSRDIRKLESQIRLNKSETNLLRSEIDGINIKNIKFKITKKNIPFAKTVNYGDGKPVSYMAKFKDEIIFVAGYGNILYSKPENFLSDTKIKYAKIKNNLRKKITDDAFWDLNSSIIVKDRSGWKNNLSNGVSVKGILIHKGILYIAYLKEIKKQCYATSIISAEMNLSYLEFTNFYTPANCISPLDTEFLPHAAGGRMVVYKNNQILLTVGDFSHFNIAQDDKLNFGKVISIDLVTKKSKFFSKGHRNPQGLIYLQKKDIVLSTEHGPRGGDEINKIIENGNYGWPIASYGTIIGHELKKNGPTFSNHEKNGFVEPIYHWDINPGIGQIVEIPSSFAKKLENHFFITSLSGSIDKNNLLQGESLYLVKFNEDYDGVISMDRLYIGQRIRDIIYVEKLKGFLIAMENTSSIGFVRQKK